MLRSLEGYRENRQFLAEGDAEQSLWKPLPGPQTEAFYCQADQTFYGGAAGGGKTDLLLGLAATQHQRSIIFRREFKQLEGLRERSDELYSRFGRYRGGDRELWRLVYQDIPRRVEFGAAQLIGSEAKYQGRAHDFRGFDEITHFAEQQFRFLIGWNRSVDPNQRVRIVAAGNPPTNAEGDWVIPYWGPWLDPKHPNPAQPGELRWFTTINGRDKEVPDNRQFVLIDDELVYDFDPLDYEPQEIIRPHSRTFIRAFAKDNPFYVASGYLSVLQALPEPLRSRMLLGDFGAGHEDHPQQVIPTEWVLKAQARWTAEPPGPIDSIGHDVARGGKDKEVFTPRHGPWFGMQTVYPGAATPNGWESLQHLIAVIPPGTRPAINIDIIGVGASVYDLAIGARLNAYGLDARWASMARDKSGMLGFVNKRAEWWWALREALDPLSGDDLALPPDRELLADLTAPRWTPRTRGIQIEEKDDIIDRIGRSPDKGDSLVLAHANETTTPVRTVVI